VNLVRKGKVRRIILLTLGWEELPKSVSVYGAPAELRMREPVPGVLLQTDGGWVLLDTGFNTALVRDPALYRRFFPSVEYIPVLPGPGEPIEESLHDIGVDIDDIHAVAVSHLHHDHAGGLKLFAGKVPVHAQRREVDYGLSNHPEPERHAIARIDFDDPNIDWQLADGEAEIAPGITAVPTYGHTPGHQSFVVELDESVTGGEGAKGYVFAFDAADLTENIEHELAIGGYIGVTPEETVEPIRKLKRLAVDKGYPLIPGHDPHVWPELTKHFHDRFGQVQREDAP
jgi:N-acyl homoserine lactone hydrolase